MAMNRPIPRKKKVLIVDDHPIVRYGLARVISNSMGLTVCGEADSSATTFEQIKKNNPDVILVDISLLDTDGISLTKAIRARGIGIPILIVSMHDEKIYAPKAIKSGANGFVSKSNSPAHLVNAILKVLDGEIAIDPSVKDEIIFGFAGPEQKAYPAPIEKLSDRERQIFLLVGQGFSCQEIANRLSLSPKTVDSHRSRIKIKLDVEDSKRLLIVASQWVLKEGLAPLQV